MRAFGLILALFLSPALWAKGTLTQFSVIDALLAGVYDGPFTVAELKSSGTIGLGTFNALDGELVLLDGVVYQVAHDGSVHVMPDDAQTPFVSVCLFNEEMAYKAQAMDYSQFRREWQNLSMDPNVQYVRAPDPLSENHFYAVKLTGTFKTIKARSVPKQAKPYIPLAEVVAEQSVFNFAEIEGTMVGFYCPPFASGVNVPGWHFHFLSKDLEMGGHVLDFTFADGDVNVAWQELDTLDLRLPNDRAFTQVDLTPDRTEELDKVELGK